MAEESKEVRGLLIPLSGVRLVLPDSIVLQVLMSASLTKYDDAPNWLIGALEWQKRTIPALSFELASGYGRSNTDTSRMLVVKSLNNIEKMPFYAIFLSGIPHPVNLNDDNLSVMEEAGISSPLILNQVLIEGEAASIPNLDALEEMLMSQYGLFE